MATLDDLIPCMAIPPTEIVHYEMKARRLHRRSLARRLGMSVSVLTRMLKSEAPITEDFAARLERAYGIPADCWLRLQAYYERDLRNIAERKKMQRQ